MPAEPPGVTPRLLAWHLGTGPMRPALCWHPLAFLGGCLIIGHCFHAVSNMAEALEWGNRNFGTFVGGG